MTNTAGIDYRKRPKAPASVRLRLEPGFDEVWLTGPRAGQRVAPPTPKVNYRKGA